MAKPSKKDDENDLFASKVYDLLHTDRILDNLFWEMMLDIKEKKSYKHVVQLVDDLISKHNNVLTSSFEVSELQRTAVFSEVCLMAYTIDSVLPNLLFSKLRDEFPSIIKNIIEELKHEKKIDKNILPPQKNGEIVTSNPSVSSSPPGNTLEKNTVTSTKSSLVKSIPEISTSVKSIPKSSPVISVPKSSPVKTIPKSSPAKSIPKSSPVKSIPKSSPVESTPETSTSIKSIPKSSPAPVRNQSKKTSTKKDNVPTKLYLNNKNLKTNNTKDKKEQKVVENDGDAESIEILSLTSVSSVHTSELSSFDDAISLSSGEEENGKKRIKLSLGEIQHMYQNDRISAWCAENLNHTKPIKSSENAKVNSDAKVLKNKPKKSSSRAVKHHSISKKVENNKQQTEVSSSAKPVEIKVEIEDSSYEDTAATSSPTSIEPSSPQKTLPPRIRKPNSKYVSDSILCPITLKQQKKAQQSDMTNNKTTEPALHLPQKRKKTDLEESNDNLEITLPNKEQNESDKKDEEPPVKSVKTPNSSNVYKPYSSVRLLAARRTAPVTLFSTATQNFKKS